MSDLDLEDAAPAPDHADPAPERTEVVGPDTSIRMLEVDSYDRLIHGLRTAAEGGRDLAARVNEAWDGLADLLDKVRAAMVRRAALQRPTDADATKVRRGSDPTEGIAKAYYRVYAGLDEAAKASRQIATGHRMDLQWSLWAGQLEGLRDKSSVLIRTRSQRATGLIIPGTLH